MRPLISANTMIPTTPTGTAHSARVAKRRPGLGVEDEVADVDEAADRGDDPERDLEDALHRPSVRVSAASLARAVQLALRRCGPVRSVAG